MRHERHVRLDKITHDLHDLDAQPGSDVVPAAQRFIDSVTELAEREPLSMVGVLYVNEGATNGNKVVAHRIRKGLNLDDTITLGYLDPHGAEQRPRWMEFKAKLDALKMSDDEQEACLAAARAVFKLFIELSAELSSLHATSSGG